MKIVAAAILSLSLSCPAQTPGTRDIPASQLQAILDLPLDQAVKRREVYKVPLKAAYARQIALTDRDCLAESAQQQPYNICMGHAEEQADADYAVFYNNLQLICHGPEELTAMQASEKVWHAYRDSAMQAEHAAWPDGTGAPGFAAQVSLTLLRNRMSELRLIFGLNIAQ
jgi:uncharacterized protein YecT (DUF1311 family)